LFFGKETLDPFECLISNTTLHRTVSCGNASVGNIKLKNYDSEKKLFIFSGTDISISSMFCYIVQTFMVGYDFYWGSKGNVKSRPKPGCFLYYKLAGEKGENLVLKETMCNLFLSDPTLGVLGMQDELAKKDYPI
jgi:hypothetical protein